MKNVLIFVSGVALGSVVTWKLIEKKYKDLADEEIESVKETFKNRKKFKKENIEEVVHTILNKPKDEEEIIHTAGYVSTDISEDEEETEEEIEERNSFIDVETGIEVVIPYIIRPEQFGEFEEYGTKSLTLYADGVITDEINQPITEDLDIMLGADNLSHFGEYEADSVYIRDETNEMDYEVLKSEKLFSEISQGTAN